MSNRVSSKIARGSAEVAILSLLAEQPLYGFEITKRIEQRTRGALSFTLASLYPMLYELEKPRLDKRALGSQSGWARPPLLLPDCCGQEGTCPTAPRVENLFPGA